MRILHLNSEKTWRGGEQQVLYLVEELKKYAVSCFIACKRKSALSRRCKQYNLAHFDLPFCGELDLYSAYLIKRICQKHKIDIVHAHASHAHSIAFFSFLLGNHRPLIISRRVDYPLRRNLLSRMKYNTSAVKKILCVSHRARLILESNIKDRHNLMTIHSGIDTKRFQGKTHANSQQLRKRYTLAKNCVLVGNTSALSPQKDYYTFIDSAAKVLERIGTIHKNPNQVHFFIIGEGKSRAQLERYVKVKKLDKYIHFTGFYDNIIDILPELDIFLFTSQEEALGTAILDAFAAHVPVVVTSVGGIPEMVENGRTGFLAKKKDSVSLSQHVLRLIDNPKLRKKIAAAAHEKLQDFSKERTAASTYQVYREVMDAL